MKVRSVFLSLVSITAGIVLIVALVRVAKVDPRAILQQLEYAKPVRFIGLALLMAFNIFLSGQKWQLMDRVLRRESDAALSRSAYFAFTSVGVALGQVVPTQVSMAVARVLGTQFRGRALTRGTVATLFDQGTDFLVVCFVIPASLISRVSLRGPWVWYGLATAMAVTALVTVSSTVSLIERMATRFSAHGKNPANRWRRGCLELIQSGLLQPSLFRNLFAISLLRFAVLVLMAGETSRAIGSTIPLWQLAASMPFVVLSNALAITPGGIGLNEFTFTTALRMFGTPLTAAAEWSLANRALTAASAFAIAACTAVVILLRSLIRRGNSFSSSKLASYRAEDHA